MARTHKDRRLDEAQRAVREAQRYARIAKRQQVERERERDEEFSSWKWLSRDYTPVTS